MSDLVTALGLFLAFEGVIYAGFPGFVKRMGFDVSQMDEGHLRTGGLIALAVGFGLVWLIRG